MMGVNEMGCTVYLIKYSSICPGGVSVKDYLGHGSSHMETFQSLGNSAYQSYPIGAREQLGSHPRYPDPS